MSKPCENTSKKPEHDDLELEPEMVKDLDVGDDEGGQLRGGCSFTSATPAGLGPRPTAM